MAKAPTLNQLIALDDAEVRQRVGVVFEQCLRANAHVSGTFFNAPALEFLFPGGDQEYIDRVAVALVCWSLAHTSQYDFHLTVNGESAKAMLGKLLSPDNDNFVSVTDAIYRSQFAQYCRKDGVAFSDFLPPPTKFIREVSLFDESWRDQYVRTILSDAFVAKTLARKAVDPAAFPQHVFLLSYKAWALAGNDESGFQVPEKWRPHVAGARWTTYEAVLQAQYTEQKFLPEVKSKVGVSRKTGRIPTSMVVSGSGQGHTTYRDTFVFGEAVENWVNGMKRKYPDLFTGNAPNNRP